MFGLFQADLPIGNRLWAIILVLVISGALSSGTVTLSEDPVTFVSQTLLFFGYIDVLSGLIMIGPVMIGQIIGFEVSRRRWKGSTYKEAVSANRSDTLDEILSRVGFIIAIIIAIPNYGTTQMQVVGVIGLSLLLIVEWLDINLMYKNTAQILELKADAETILTAKLYTDGQETLFSINSHILCEVSELLNNDWEIISLAELGAPPHAMLKRSVQTSRFEALRLSKQRNHTTPIRRHQESWRRKIANLFQESKLRLRSRKSKNIRGK